MTPSAIALLGFAAWTLALLGVLGGYRTMLVMNGTRRANEFRPDGADVSEFSQRLCRTHANCYENLPVFAAVILVAMFSGKTAITDPLALWFLGFRLAQSVTHLVSTSPRAVLLRFGFFLAQYLILVFLVVRLFSG